MEPIQAIVLGIIQGLTEFLPVSSSGHLVIFQHLFQITAPVASFDIYVHLGTLFVVIIFFRKDLMAMLTALIKSISSLCKQNTSSASINNSKDTGSKELKLAFLIVAGSIPTGIIGIFFYKIADKLFSSILLVGFMLLITGILLWLTRIPKQNNKGIDKFSASAAIIIGLVQGTAIMPGISRSGSTIAVGLLLGLDKQIAARYSFLLSIPAICGATVLDLFSTHTSPMIPAHISLIGMCSSFIVGYFALSLLMYLVKNGRMYVFSPYCFLAGGIALLLGT
jgi:undecaprenyl-diphosphatase